MYAIITDAESNNYFKQPTPYFAGKIGGYSVLRSKRSLLKELGNIYALLFQPFFIVDNI